MAGFRYAQLCPLACAAEIVGERWTLLILRELILGPQRFSDLARRSPGLSPSILTERLGRLEDRGVDPRHVPEIEVEDGTLVLRGERKQDAAVPRESYLRTERAHGRFVLQLALPPSVDRHKIVASQSLGVLEVVLPKSRQDTPSRIKVQVQ